jgi:anti-sigma regulatory factor (Ser/Thr protein kinase)
MIRLDLLSILEHRDVALRAVAIACKQVAPKPEGPAGGEFRIQVVSALGEAFNNIVLHGYSGRRDGLIKLRIEPRAGEIRIELRDWGKSFDPKAVPLPDLSGLPESGLGLFIIHSFMEVGYSPGRPNVLILCKKLETQPDRKASEGTLGSGGPKRGA